MPRLDRAGFDHIARVPTYETRGVTPLDLIEIGFPFHWLPVAVHKSHHDPGPPGLTSTYQTNDPRRNMRLTRLRNASRRAPAEGQPLTGDGVT